MYGLPLHQAGQQGHVGRLPSPGWETHPDLVELVPQELPTVLGLGPSEDSTKERGIETFRRRESPLDLRYRDFVLGGGGQEGEAARGGAEDLVSKLGPDLTVMVTVLTLTELSLDWEGKV